MTVPPYQPEAMFLDLSARTKLRVGGADRLRFLNGQITNDAAKATPSGGIAASVLNAKGKMEGQIFLAQDIESFLIDADPEQREKLKLRFERYIIADDVAIEDVSAQFSIFHVPAPTGPEVPEFCRLVEVNRFRAPGWDVWVEMGKRDEVFEQLSGNYSFCDDACTEVFRIEQGIGRWGREWTEEIIPVEAGLEETAIDYEKGCYIGQEVVSRMKMSGQRNKKLCGFVSLYDLPLEPGMKIFPVGEEKKEAGWITSAAHSKRLGKEIALGYMKRPFYHSSYRLDAISPDNIGRAAVRVELADLPFSGPGSHN
jgi:tRNA-modifying protein YgfZ